MPSAEKDTVWRHASVMQFVLTVSETPKTHVVFQLLSSISTCPSLEREFQTARKLSPGQTCEADRYPLNDQVIRPPMHLTLRIVR